MLTVFFTAGIASAKYPYGGKCERPRINILKKASATVIKGSRLRLRTNPYQKTCRHNVSFPKGPDGTVMKITTRRGDGIGNKGRVRQGGWSDIAQGNRRRFEFHLKRSVRDGQAFMFEYSVRVAEGHQFMEGPEPDVSNEAQIYVFQLKSDSVGSPVISVKLSQSQGITAMGFVAQPPSKFGEWVKIRIEFRPSRKENGFTRLWVDGKQLMNESGYRTVWSGESRDRHNIKFGIYQLHLDPNKIKADTQQSIEFKDIRFKLISK